MLSSNMIIKRSGDILASEVEGEVVMMSIDQGKYFGLDQIGGDIWKKLEEPKSIAIICEDLSKEYNADASTIKHDVEKFLSDLLENNIIEIVNS